MLEKISYPVNVSRPLYTCLNLEILHMCELAVPTPYVQSIVLLGLFFRMNFILSIYGITFVILLTLIMTLILLISLPASHLFLPRARVGSNI